MPSKQWTVVMCVRSFCSKHSKNDGDDGDDDDDSETE